MSKMSRFSTRSKAPTTARSFSNSRMDSEAKIRILNRMLAVRCGPEYADKYLQSTRAIDFAFKRGSAIAPLGEFAKSIIKIYDSEAELEFIDIGSDYFDPLFVIDSIAAAVKRLAGQPKPILVVAGMDRSAKNGSKWSAKRRREYFNNLDIVESYVLRYEKSIPQIEIIFI